MQQVQEASPEPGRSVADLTLAYRSGNTEPAEVCLQAVAEIGSRGDDGVWITVADEAAVLSRCRELASADDAASMPLFGIPFAVKDSIDIAGWPTTLACPRYAYDATDTAPVVSRLLDAGAVLIGKTNLDQFATGLNGTRTPYRIPRSVYGGDLISGGSSSGSALAVALGEVSFAVATDTAGSGRVPAALNGIFGFKPSRGLISTAGLVPACRSLDCISLMAGSVADLDLVFDVVAARDRRDPWSRTRRHQVLQAQVLRIGLPAFEELEFFGDRAMAGAHLQARRAIAERFATAYVPLQPFVDAGDLLYQGPWVAERFVEFGDFLSREPQAALPVITEIIQAGSRYSAADVFRAQYRLAELKAGIAELFDAADVVILPTIGTTFTVEEVLADPITTNTRLGRYTHCGNLLDLCAAAVPAGITADGRPVSCMVLGPALADDAVLTVASELAAIFFPPDCPPEENHA